MTEEDKITAIMAKLARQKKSYERISRLLSAILRQYYNIKCNLSTTPDKLQDRYYIKLIAESKEECIEIDNCIKNLCPTARFGRITLFNFPNRVQQPIFIKDLSDKYLMTLAKMCNVSL